jgi:hypothetical protein
VSDENQYVAAVLLLIAGSFVGGMTVGFAIAMASTREVTEVDHLSIALIRGASTAYRMTF